MPAVLDRPDALPFAPARPDQQRPEALGADLDRRSPTSSPVVAETAAIVCERLWASAQSTIMTRVHLHLDW